MEAYRRGQPVTMPGLGVPIALTADTVYLPWKGSISNRELAALKRMFNFAPQQTPPKVTHKPYIPMLEENNIRTGFFEYDEFMALRAALLEYLKPLATFADVSAAVRDHLWGASSYSPSTPTPPPMAIPCSELPRLAQTMGNAH
jgi:hypothetical protein